MKYAVGLIGTVIGVLSASTASAETLTVSITAHVPTFCHIYPPDESIIDVRQGTGTIGVVREVCNTPQGYDVSTSFTNLTRGNLVVDGSPYAVVDGVAHRSSAMAAVRTMMWSLNEAAVSDETQPVVMQVTISPR
jgi:hypothetical protein